MNRKLFIFAGPSGVGKSYIMAHLQARYPDEFKTPKLFTTRAPRSNETGPDRHFISQQEFDDMKQRGDFMFADFFNNNWYGYSHESVVPRDKHLLINNWPAMLPQFAALPGAVVVGMKVSAGNMRLLENRIAARGEDPKAFAIRMERVKVDLADLEKYDHLVQKHGKLFEIIDDRSADAIEEWIRYNYL